MTRNDATTVVSAKIPTDLAERAEACARGRQLSLSALIRRLLEDAVADSDLPPGPVEAAARIEIEQWGLTNSETRVAAALNLARRLDVDPTNGSSHARELRLLLDDLSGQPSDHVSPVTAIQARRILRKAGFTVYDPDGNLVAGGAP